MSKFPVSVCIICKNEEKHMEECLKRLMPYGFEIVVTDTGSTDRTREIAEKYADKVLDFEWINDFSAARNFCTENASNNWILVIDCDEYVSSINMNELRMCMQQFPKGVGAIRLKSLANFKGSKVYNTEDIIRFYNKNYYAFDMPVHEQVYHKEKEKRDEIMEYFLLPMEVIHHGYELTPEEMQLKQKRNLDLLYASLEKKKDAYTYFQIGQSEFLINNIEKAVLSFEQGLALKPEPELEFTQSMIRGLAKAYMRLDRNEDALSLMEKYSDRCKSAGYSYTHAVTLEECGHTLKALLMYVKVSMMPDIDTLGENLLFCYKHIMKLYTDMGNYEMAELFRGKYEECLKEKERILNS